MDSRCVIQAGWQGYSEPSRARALISGPHGSCSSRAGGGSNVWTPNGSGMFNVIYNGSLSSLVNNNLATGSVREHDGDVYSGSLYTGCTYDGSASHNCNNWSNSPDVNFRWSWTSASNPGSFIAHASQRCDALLSMAWFCVYQNQGEW